MTSRAQTNTIKTSIRAEDPDDGIKSAVAKRIKEMRGGLGLTASQVAKKLKISREAFTHIETGRNGISAVSLWKLAALFHCDIQDFFPKVPDGFQLTKVDIKKVAQEDEKAVEWAKKLFADK
ncbi:MAG: helix-turn-helix domain-containing protein [Patescibacteria group bacterium]|nr:helix-turn-helix domain-containing protein [Patescibacteria group bacterium]MCL5262042.1 helix-turn-helix domain-containing protein [Patescibacteria group bacterium]